MSKYRRDRINDRVGEELAQILREVSDPRLAGALLSVTGAEVSPDLKYAKIFYSSLGGEPSEVKAGLASAGGFIRGQLAKRLNLRITPELTFVRDASLEHGAEIAAILKKIDLPPEEDPDGKAEDKKSVDGASDDEYYDDENENEDADANESESGGDVI